MPNAEAGTRPGSSTPHPFQHVSHKNILFFIAPPVQSLLHEADLIRTGSKDDNYGTSDMDLPCPSG